MLGPWETRAPETGDVAAWVRALLVDPGDVAAWVRALLVGPGAACAAHH